MDCFFECWQIKEPLTKIYQGSNFAKKHPLFIVLISSTHGKYVLKLFSSLLCQEQ